MNIQDPKTWTPIFVNGSRIPKMLSWLAPIKISAITIFPFVFSREIPSQRTIRHETIHFQQFLETGVIGFYLIYFWDYAKARLSGLSGKDAYRKIRAEVEAYENDEKEGYLLNRKRWKWLQTN